MNAVAPDPRRWKALILICTAIFVVVLDIAIVNVALPTIQDDLNFAERNLQWVITAYGLTYGGFLLLGGRAADLIGRRIVFMTGLAIFGAASLVCGLSTSSGMLIAARGVQGFGAAIVTPAALSIISVTFTEGAERNKALGAWGAVGGSGAAAGVLMGGVLTKYLGWEWIFWVNVPVAVIVLILTPIYVRESRREDVVHEYDLPGAISVTAGLIVLVYAISEAPQVGWGTFRTIGLLVLSGLLLAFFLWWEAREKEPLMPLSIFRIRLVAAANLGGLLLAGGLYGTFLMLTLYMQQVLHMSVLQTGVAFLATAGTAVLMAGPAQALTTRYRREAGARRRHEPARRRVSLVHADRRQRLVPDGFASGILRGRHRDPVLVHPDHDRGARRSQPREGGARFRADQHVAAGGRRDRDGGALDRLRHAFEDAARGADAAERSVDPGLRVGLLGRGRDLGRGAARCDLPRAARGGRAARAGRDPRLADLSGLPVTGLNELVLEVADLDAAARFYGEVLGLPPLSRSDNRAWFLVGERSRIGLWTPQVGIAGGRGGAHVHYAMHVGESDYDAAVARSARTWPRSCTKRTSKTRAPLYVTDPDGNVVELWTWGT